MNSCGFKAQECLTEMLEKNELTTKRLFSGLFQRFDFLVGKFSHHVETEAYEIFSEVYLKLYDARRRNPGVLLGIKHCCVTYMKMIGYRWLLDQIDDVTISMKDILEPREVFEEFDDEDSIRVKRWKECEEKVLTEKAYAKWQAYKKLKYVDGKNAGEISEILGHTSSNGLHGWVHSTTQKIKKCFVL